MLMVVLLDSAGFTAQLHGYGLGLRCSRAHPSWRSPWLRATPAIASPCERPSEPHRAHHHVTQALEPVSACSDRCVWWGRFHGIAPPPASTFQKAWLATGSGAFEPSASRAQQ